jgi:hypothetical protein
LDERGRLRRSKLVFKWCDLEAKKKGYSSKSYKETLTKGLLLYHRRSELFIQDNAGIYTSYAVKVFLLRLLEGSLVKGNNDD